MVVSGSVEGRAELQHIRDLLNRVPEKLRKDLADGTRAALRPLKEEIPAAEQARLPHRYGVILAGATKVAVRVTASEDISATVRVSAMGKTAERDVRRMNLGQLRHPVFGRYRRTRHGRKANPWVLQGVRPGMVDDPVEQAGRRIVANAEDARDKSADMILRE